jgi:ABC-type branched-subunit amino acid transport system permease subunit
VLQIASLTNVHWHTSGEVVLMTLIGGMGAVWGPIVGAFLLTMLQNYLAQMGSWITIRVWSSSPACCCLGKASPARLRRCCANLASASAFFPARPAAPP